MASTKETSQEPKNKISYVDEIATPPNRAERRNMARVIRHRLNIQRRHKRHSQERTGAIASLCGRCGKPFFGADRCQCKAYKKSLDDFVDEILEQPGSITPLRNVMPARKRGK